MKIKPIKLVEPTKAQKEIFEEYFIKHNKGLRAIKALKEIKQLLEEALNPEKTDDVQSIECLYKALKKCKESDEIYGK